MSKAKKPAAIAADVPAKATEETIITEVVETAEVVVESKPAAIAADVPAVTSTVISSSATPVEEDTRLVKIRVNYPGDYKGRRILKDGKEYSVSPETAESLIKKGIAGKI